MAKTNKTAGKTDTMGVEDAMNEVSRFAKAAVGAAKSAIGKRVKRAKGAAARMSGPKKNAKKGTKKRTAKKRIAKK